VFTHRAAQLLFWSIQPMAPIYTRSGDAGDTGLFGGGRVQKDDERVEAYGEVDELNAALGWAAAEQEDGGLRALCLSIQNQLFTVGSQLATPAGTKAAAAIPKLSASWATEMEARIDAFDAELSPLSAFILPGGHRAAAALHFARTVCGGPSGASFPCTERRPSTPPSSST
jgi:cob(I)alamin adenosyltransferase